MVCLVDVLDPVLDLVYIPGPRQYSLTSRTPSWTSFTFLDPVNTRCRPGPRFKRAKRHLSKGRPSPGLLETPVKTKIQTRTSRVYERWDRGDSTSSIYKKNFSVTTNFRWWRFRWLLFYDSSIFVDLVAFVCRRTLSCTKTTRYSDVLTYNCPSNSIRVVGSRGRESCPTFSVFR